MNHLPQRLPPLAQRLPGRWATGRRRASAALSPEALLAALDQVADDAPLRAWGMLEWLHVLRHKARWDATHPTRAEPVAARIWRMAVDHPALQAQVVARLVDGLCGGEGLPGSMVAIFHRDRPLAGADPLLQDIIAALSRVGTSPGELIQLCLAHNRSPRALLRRVHLPDDLPLLEPVEAAIPAFVQARARPPEAARAVSQWLLTTLSDAQPGVQDRIAAGLLATLSPEDARAIPDLCWWLSEVYHPAAPRSRHRFLPGIAQQTLGVWLAGTGRSER